MGSHQSGAKIVALPKKFGDRSESRTITERAPDIETLSLRRAIRFHRSGMLGGPSLVLSDPIAGLP